MATMKFALVTALPGSLVADTMYFVTGTNANYVEIYVRGTSETRRIPTMGDIQNLLDGASDNAGTVEIVDNIADRNALSLTNGLQVLVIDATADNTVAAGGATYVYRSSNSSWIKIAEHATADLSLTWAAIQGRPSSSVADIDAAVAARHSHTNMTQLNLIGQDAQGELTYGGQNVRARLEAADW